jgi:hypothetical protein
MSRKTVYILDRELPSKVYLLLLFKKEYSSAYSLAKNVYGSNFRTANRIYSLLKELERLKLITSVYKKGGKRNEKIIKPNLIEFVKVLSERNLPVEYRLDTADVEELAKYIGSLDLQKLIAIYSHKPLQETVKSFRQAEIHTPTVLGVVSVMLKFEVVGLNLTTPESKYPEGERGISLRALQKEVSALSEPLREKLLHLTIPKNLEALLTFMRNTQDISS